MPSPRHRTPPPWQMQHSLNLWKRRKARFYLQPRPRGGIPSVEYGAERLNWTLRSYTTPKPCNSSNGKRFKIAQKLPFVKEVNEECAPAAESILEDPDISTRRGAVSLLAVRQETFRKRLKVQSTQNAVLKLPMHNNAEQRELTLHIGSLQCALDKPTLPEKLSLAARESFHIMDISEELSIPEDFDARVGEGGPMEANSRITSDVEKTTSGRHHNETDQSKQMERYSTG